MEQNQLPETLAASAPPGLVPASPTAASPPRPLEVNKITYVGQTGALYGIWLRQVFLSILTLGIYHFWGKTKLRNYLLGATELAGDRFEYLGTGKELFLGVLKILPIYLGVFLIGGIVEYKYKYPGVSGILILLLIPYLLPVARYSGFRYRINRVSWRGVRGNMRGSALAFGWKYLGGSLLAIVTLGFKNPSIDLGRWEYQVQNMRFGSQQYQFKGNPANLRKTNIITLLLAIPTFGLSRMWYMAALQREKLRGLSLGNIRFRFTATGGDLLKFSLGNVAIMIFTLGLVRPLVMARNVRFFTRVVAIGGDLKAFNAEQAAALKPGDAEGLLDVLDVDIGMVDMIGA